MLNSVLTIGFFLALGIGWRILTPRGISADSLQRQLMALVNVVFLPIGVFFLAARLPLDGSALRILWYVVVTNAITLAVSWLWLSKTALPPKTKGALLIAASFGNVFFLGLPLNKMLLADWSMRIAMEYGIIANVVLLFTAGAVLSKSFTETGKSKFKKPIDEVLKDYRVWTREPLVWAVVIGLGFNVLDMKVPYWLDRIEMAVFGMLIPLLLLSVALAVNWTKSWKNQLANVVPIAVIQLILVPLIMWGTIKLFGSPGLKTARALLLDSMLPASVLGFAACERYKLDAGSYGVAFSVTSALAVVTIPIWFKIIIA